MGVKIFKYFFETFKFMTKFLKQGSRFFDRVKIIFLTEMDQLLDRKSGFNVKEVN